MGWGPNLSLADDDRRLIGRREVATADRRLLGRLRIERVTALDDLGWLHGQGPWLAPECSLEHLLHVVDQDELDRLPDLIRDVAQVLLVLARQDHDPGAGE